MARTKRDLLGTESREVVDPKGAKGTSGRKEASSPRSLAISERGVRTGEDFANLMSALMSDVIQGRIDPVIANATCNAGGKLLKVVEMQYRYGKQDSRERSLALASGT